MSVLNFGLPYVQLLVHNKYVVQYSGYNGKNDKEMDLPKLMTRILPETGLHFDLFTVHCTRFPIPGN
jgi:hypothetical protein